MSAPNAKLKLIAREYLSNGLNASKAVMKFKPNIKQESAETMASHMLHSDKFNQALMECVPSEHEDLDVIRSAYKAKRPKNIAWNDLHKFNELSLKAKGKLGNDNTKANTNIGIIIER